MPTRSRRIPLRPMIRSMKLLQTIQQQIHQQLKINEKIRDLEKELKAVAILL
jgi:hypothetical protein